MAAHSPKDLTQMLIDWRGGHREALAQIMPVVYDELRRLANRYLLRERPGHTLQATALVHEAFLRLVDQKSARWENRAHFFAIAAHSMRQILVNHALSRRAAKRGGPDYKLSLNAANCASNEKEREVDLIALEDALQRLAAIDPQQSRIVELRFFGGLTIKETAEVLGISPATVKREWNTARSWLYCEIAGGDARDT